MKDTPYECLNVLELLTSQVKIQHRKEEMLLSDLKVRERGGCSWASGD